MSFCLLLYCLLVLFLFSFLGEWEKSKRVISWFIYNSYKLFYLLRKHFFIYLYFFTLKKKHLIFFNQKKIAKKTATREMRPFCAWRSFLALEFLYIRYPGELVGRYQVPPLRHTETNRNGSTWVPMSGQKRAASLYSRVTYSAGIGHGWFWRQNGSPLVIKESLESIKSHDDMKRQSQRSHTPSGWWNIIVFYGWSLWP